MGRGSSGAKTAARNTKSGGAANAADNANAAKAPQSSVNTSDIKKYGFASVQQLQDYVDWDNSRKQVKGREKEAPVTVEDGSFIGKNKAVIRANHSGVEAENFVQEMKTKLNISVDNWLNDSWIVTLDRDANYRKKPKPPKSNKKS